MNDNTTPATRPASGENKTLLYPGAQNAYVQVVQPKPCITILIHGVNDLAGVYADIEKGLCEGLNERLDHLSNARGQINAAALIPATYSLPTAHDHLAPDPDKVYFRRLANTGKGGDTSRSVVIPFYWGFREDNGKNPKTKLPYLQKETPHGEWLDRYNNRLDKAGTKEGGAFANATTTLPDMWKQGFSGMIFGILPMNAMVGTPGHPLYPAPPRNYMLLGAQRLAMLIKIIRTRQPDDTINVVAHSQGTMLTMLANALLKDDGQRPIDSAVFMNSPYSLKQPGMERMQIHKEQQTYAARRETLGNIIRFIGAQPHAQPSLTQMADPSQPACIGGLRWTGQQCATTLNGQDTRFGERDNRGNVTLYFTPQDQTVGLLNVQGIGWQGVPDETLGQLGPRFHQRVFTLRERNGQAEEVGVHPPGYRYVLRQRGESTWDGNGQGWTGNLIKAELKEGQTVTLNAPVLPAALRVNFDGTDGVVDDESRAKSKDGIHMVKGAMDPIDASIGITNGAWVPGVFKRYDLPASDPALANGFVTTDVQDALNADKQAFDYTRVKSVTPLGNGMVRVMRTETPSDARKRLMETPEDQLTKDDALSFHSAIPANSEHSRKAVAYDLAIGQAKCIDDEVCYSYLCRIADWRLGWTQEHKKENDVRLGGRAEATSDRIFDDAGPNADILAFYQAEAPDNKALIDATADYRTTGLSNKYPQYFNPKLPSLVKSETLEQTVPSPSRVPMRASI
jgi:pimeloyl-ACP methyl ester carboxylesterase